MKKKKILGAFSLMITGFILNAISWSSLVYRPWNTVSLLLGLALFIVAAVWYIVLGHTNK